MATYSLVIRRLMIVSLTIVVSRAITSPLLTLFLIGSKAILGENLPIGQRAKAFSLRYTLTNIGYATGPMLGVVIAGVYPIAPFLIAAGIAFSSIFLMMGIPGDGTPTAAMGPPPSFLKTLQTLKNDRTLIMFTCGCLLSTVVHGRFTLYLSQYLLVTHDAKRALEIMAALLACNAITVILLQYQIGRFLDREKLRYWIAAGTSLFILGLIGFSLADDMLSWCVAMFIFTLGEMIIYPAEFLFVDTLAPEELRGSYYGAQNLAALGGALSPVICGYLLIQTPAPTMFYALSALTAMGGLLCFMSGRRVAVVQK